MTSSFSLKDRAARDNRPKDGKEQAAPGAQFGSRMIQYSTSFSPFSEISFWNCVTILSRRAITALTSFLVR